MARPTYPPGDTAASRVKSLMLWVRQRRGQDAAISFVRGIEMDTEYLEDETRPIPVAAWHRALVAFARLYGRDVIRETWSGVVDAENLGVWTRVLRGTLGIESALAQLDSLGGDELKTWRWDLASVNPGTWRARITISHDPGLEADGLLRLARSAELIGIPFLFGYGPGQVDVVAAPSPSSGSSQGGTPGPTGGRMSEEYVLRWRVPDVRRGWLTAGVSAAAAAPVAAFTNGGAALAAALVAGAAGAAGGVAWQASKKRQADSFAQMSRIRALERSVALKEQRERAAIGFFEGSVVAGKYRLGPKLGAGASGVIHQAIRLADNAPVAIKLLRAAVAHDTVASDRLRREAEALGLTWHPNVVEVFDHDHLPDGTAYLVMEHLDGESLATRLRRLGALDPEEIASIITQVCDALGAVHAAGVIHRDVKPSNIFLATGASGGPPEVKLLDFGIARVEWAETRLTNMGSPLGTPGYMSPEQEQGGDVDPRSDLYALGAVAYECFAGVPPPTPVSGRFEIAPAASHPSASRQGSAHRIPAAWRALIHRAMAPLPQERFRSARVMREAVAALARGRSSDATAGLAQARSSEAATEVSASARPGADGRKTNVSK